MFVFFTRAQGKKILKTIVSVTFFCFLQKMESDCGNNNAGASAAMEDATPAPAPAPAPAVPTIFRTIPPLCGSTYKTNVGPNSLQSARERGQFVEVIVRDRVYRECSYWQVPFTHIDMDDWSVLVCAYKASLPADRLAPTIGGSHLKAYTRGREACLYRLLGWCESARMQKLFDGAIDETDANPFDSAKWPRTQWSLAGPPTPRPTTTTTTTTTTTIDNEEEEEHDGLTREQRRRACLLRADRAAAEVQLAHNPQWYMRIVLRITTYDKALHRDNYSALLRHPLAMPFFTPSQDDEDDDAPEDHGPFFIEDGFSDHSASCDTIARLVDENTRLKQRLEALLEASYSSTPEQYRDPQLKLKRLQAL